MRFHYFKTVFLRKPIISRAIIENSVVVSLTKHHQNCKPIPWNILAAEQYDREQRANVKSFTGDVKSLHREVELIYHHKSRK